MALGTVQLIGRVLFVSTICCLLATSVDAQY